MHLTIQALSLASLHETNISNKRNLVKNPNCQEADQLAIYKAWPRIWTREYRETDPASGREALNPGPMDYNTSALNYSATLPSCVCLVPSFLAPDFPPPQSPLVTSVILLHTWNLSQ